MEFNDGTLGCLGSLLSNSLILSESNTRRSSPVQAIFCWYFCCLSGQGHWGFFETVNWWVKWPPVSRKDFIHGWHGWRRRLGLSQLRDSLSCLSSSSLQPALLPHPYPPLLTSALFFYLSGKSKTSNQRHALNFLALVLLGCMSLMVPAPGWHQKSEGSLGWGSGEWLLCSWSWPYLQEAIVNFSTATWPLCWEINALGFRETWHWEVELVTFAEGCLKVTVTKSQSGHLRVRDSHLTSPAWGQKVYQSNGNDNLALPWF